MVQAYWQIGYLIVEHEQEGKERAGYGKGPYSGTPMILCVSHFIFGLLRRLQTYIFSGLLGSRMLRGCLD
jgi:hypothetical protein